MTWMLIKGVVSLFILVIMYFLIGSAVFSTFYAVNGKRVWQLIFWGFIYSLGIFELISLPFLILNKGFMALYATALFVFGIIIIWSLYVVMNRKTYKCINRKKKDYLSYIISGVILGIAIFIAYYSIDSGDDGYYVAIANQAIEQGEIILDDASAYAGNDYFRMLGFRPEVISWELFGAVVCKLFHVHPAVFFHSILPLLLIPIGYAVMYEIAIKIFGDTSYAKKCLLIYILLTVGNGCGLPLLIWIGKYLIPFLLFPALFSIVMDIYQKKETAISWVSIFFILIAGCGVSGTGVCMMPLYCMALGIPYIAFLIYTKDRERILQLFGKALGAVSGLIFIASYSLISLTTIEDIFSNLKFISWKEAFIDNLTGYLIGILWLACIWIFLSKEKLEWKVLFCGSALFVTLVFVNPLTFNIMRRITSEWTYSRLYQMYSSYIIIAIWCIWIGRSMNEKLVRRKGKVGCFERSGGVILIGIVVLSLLMPFSKRNIFHYYGKHNNWYMIPDAALDIAQYLGQRETGIFVVLLPGKILPYVRQYTSYADVINVKYGDTKKVIDAGGFKIEGEILQKYIKLRQSVYNNGDLKSAEVREIIDFFKVDYIVTEAYLGMCQGEFIFKKQFEHYYIYSK